MIHSCFVFSSYGVSKQGRRLNAVELQPNTVAQELLNIYSSCLRVVTFYFVYSLRLCLFKIMGLAERECSRVRSGEQ